MPRKNTQAAPAPVSAKRSTTKAPPAQPPKPAPIPVVQPTAKAPAPAAEAPQAGGKLGQIVTLLRRSQGATIADLMKATGWQRHSVRGAIAGTLKKRGFTIISEKPGEVRIYRIEPPPEVAAARTKLGKRK